MSQVSVTKIDNGYLVAYFDDDNTQIGAVAVEKNPVGNINPRKLARAVTSFLGRCLPRKKTRVRRPKAVPAAA